MCVAANYVDFNRDNSSTLDPPVIVLTEAVSTSPLFVIDQSMLDVVGFGTEVKLYMLIVYQYEIVDFHAVIAAVLLSRIGHL